MDMWTDARTDGHDIMAIKPKFLASMGYHIFLRTAPANSKVFLRGLQNMREKQILTSIIEIQKENWG